MSQPNCGFRTVTVAITLGLLALSSSAVNAGVVISNLGTPALSTVGTDPRFGQSVVAGSTVAVNSVTLALRGDSLFDSNARLVIRGGSFGSGVFSVNTQTVPEGSPVSNFTFTAPPNTVMNAGVTYSIAIADASGTGNFGGSWAYNSSAGTGVAGWTIPASLNNPSTGRQMLSIDATPVPEPTTLAALGLGTALLRRRRS